MNSDGINYLNTLLQNPDVPTPSRITICRIITNIALELNTAEILVKCDEEIEDVITTLLINADYGSQLFFQCVKFIRVFLETLSNSKSIMKYKLLFMKNLNEKNIFNILSDSLEMDYEIDIKNNKWIKDINAHIAAIVNTYISCRINGLVITK